MVSKIGLNPKNGLKISNTDSIWISDLKSNRIFICPIFHQSQTKKII